ncbi:hypothetical protein Tco_0173237 [Tanacetum coccineum]
MIDSEATVWPRLRGSGSEQIKRTKVEIEPTTCLRTSAFMAYQSRAYFLIKLMSIISAQLEGGDRDSKYLLLSYTKSTQNPILLKPLPDCRTNLSKHWPPWDTVASPVCISVKVLDKVLHSFELPESVPLQQINYEVTL